MRDNPPNLYENAMPIYRLHNGWGFLWWLQRQPWKGLVVLAWEYHGEVFASQPLMCVACRAHCGELVTLGLSFTESYLCSWSV